MQGCVEGEHDAKRPRTQADVPDVSAPSLDTPADAKSSAPVAEPEPQITTDTATSDDKDNKMSSSCGVARLVSIPSKFGKLTVAAGSVVDFSGDAIVNAANTGCVGGGGVDGAISARGGYELQEAREALPIVGSGYTRCPVGDAKTTIAGDLDSKWVIHAVGPNYHHFDDEEEADEKLYAAYRSAMREARAHKMETVGFSLLSAGIFRGSRQLEPVLRIGLVAVAANVYPELKEAFLIAFTQREQDTLQQAASILCPEPENGIDWAGALAEIESPELKQLHEASMAQLQATQTTTQEPAPAPSQEVASTFKQESCSTL
uniref:Macro domain-containing protein n=1 Tax=Coccolithus braarudii TaxID=221442 RepID=A0A7S0Q840_9EUKA|mmetsp:Transcript_4728/g.10309  ORF Transcript_4728/g.10309 Transcript_4728/m.10309 type:complete len:318 (+) Transcript_4728:13-966(+)|eukprot:CAMPEP_0183331582 /NCGR_PEP_ID=MMETSP0164_2-20130417/926_1 /TAXON_ID=221442 /ORGANISM="Coccolithus pelagicus ssp braarudi, Strain PLY182g" /LENGTH=317 /DNA_ID=CAMNT_0025500095 /DNA_START=1 /DNA_END=954 /DNA_ORIENTATION=+